MVRLPGNVGANQRPRFPARNDAVGFALGAFLGRVNRVMKLFGVNDKTFRDSRGTILRN